MILWGKRHGEVGTTMIAIQSTWNHVTAWPEGEGICLSTFWSMRRWAEMAFRPTVSRYNGHGNSVTGIGILVDVCQIEFVWCLFPGVPSTGLGGNSGFWLDTWSGGTALRVNAARAVRRPPTSGCLSMILLPGGWTGRSPYFDAQPNYLCDSKRLLSCAWDREPLRSS